MMAMAGFFLLPLIWPELFTIGVAGVLFLAATLGIWAAFP